MGAFDYFKNLYRSVIPNAAKGNRALERVAVHNAMKANDRPWEHDTDAKLQAMLSDDPMAEIKQDPNDLGGIVERMNHGTYEMPDDL